MSVFEDYNKKQHTTFNKVFFIRIYWRHEKKTGVTPAHAIKC